MITKETISFVQKMHHLNVNASYSEIADELIKFYPKVSHRTARRYVSIIINSLEPTPEEVAMPEVISDKKKGEFNWRDAVHHVQEGQKLFSTAKSSQDKATFVIKTDEPIYVLALGDAHFGSWGTDYEVLKSITDEILNTPNLYVILLGDLLQMSIKLRGVLEVSDNALPPKFQMMLLDSWLKEISHKVICSTWDNHAVMREENVTGYSKYAEIFERHHIYFNGIGHLDLGVGTQIYKIAVSHFFRGYSIENPCHGGMRYMRRMANDREIAMAGDSHNPGIIKYVDGDKNRCVVNSGTAQTNSGYAKRFFSLHTSSAFPVIKLDPHTHNFTPYWNLEEALK